MFGHGVAQTNNEKLISKLTRENLDVYIQELDKIIDDICTNVILKGHKSIARNLKFIKQGTIIFN